MQTWVECLSRPCGISGLKSVLVQLIYLIILIVGSCQDLEKNSIAFDFPGVLLGICHTVMTKTRYKNIVLRFKH